MLLTESKFAGTVSCTYASSGHLEQTVNGVEAFTVAAKSIAAVSFHQIDRVIVDESRQDRDFIAFGACVHRSSFSAVSRVAASWEHAVSTMYQVRSACCVRVGIESVSVFAFVYHLLLVRRTVPYTRSEKGLYAIQMSLR
jgi:hypothetical protein